MTTVPTILHVPVPTGHFERNYGVYSTKHHTSQRVVIRLNAPQRAIIQRAARLLEMTEAQYMREVSINTAKVIFKHAEDFNENNGNRS